MFDESLRSFNKVILYGDSTSSAFVDDVEELRESVRKREEHMMQQQLYATIEFLNEGFAESIEKCADAFRRFAEALGVTAGEAKTVWRDLNESDLDEKALSRLQNIEWTRSSWTLTPCIKPTVKPSYRPPRRSQSRPRATC